MLTLPTAQAADKIGVVLMHGKLSIPGKQFQSIESHLGSNGVLVETPEMPWSKNRQFDHGYEQAMDEIEAAVKKLRSQGATKVVIAGHSMGAAAALIYGARKPADGLILLALGHSPQTDSLAKRFARSVAHARELVASGKGDEKESFDDFDASKYPPAYKVITTARSYLSYFDPEGIANTMKSATAVPAVVPVLWVTGSGENPGLKGYGEKLYAAIPSQKRKYIEVNAGHTDTPSAAKEAVTDWLKTLQ
jgi:pimeloyl-ACP methyl ester carboxylesterase